MKIFSLFLGFPQVYIFCLYSPRAGQGGGDWTEIKNGRILRSNGGKGNNEKWE